MIIDFHTSPYDVLFSSLISLIYLAPENSPKNSGTLTEGLSATGISPSTDDIWYGVRGITQGENCYLMVP
jgi:hypothetical protein